jgi:hypothetical protein
MGQLYHWKCNWNGCSVGGTESSQAAADDAKATHMAWCDKRPS